VKVYIVVDKYGDIIGVFSSEDVAIRFATAERADSVHEWFVDGKSGAIFGMPYESDLHED